MDADEAKRDLAAVCHWYEEAPSVISSTRIFTAILIGAALCWLAVMSIYVITCLVRHEKPDQLGTMAEPLGALLPSGAVAIYARNKGV